MGDGRDPRPSSNLAGPVRIDGAGRRFRDPNASDPSEATWVYSSDFWAPYSPLGGGETMSP